MRITCLPFVPWLEIMPRPPSHLLELLRYDIFHICNSQRHSSSVVLVAAVQTRSNNRIVISGSLDMFSNLFYDQSYDNQIFGNALSLCMFSWVKMSC